MKKIIIILICLTNSICQGQEIRGKYLNISDKNGRTLIFNSDNFIDQMPGHVNDYYGTGNYEVKRGKLILNYKKVTNQDTSAYKINYKDLNVSKDSVTAINVFAFDIDSLPMPSMILTRDKIDKYISSFLTDEKGHGYIMISNNNYIKYLEVNMLGYYPISLNVKQFRGKSLELYVYLKPAKVYYIEPKKITYQIIENSKSLLVLLDENGKKISYKTVD